LLAARHELSAQQSNDSVTNIKKSLDQAAINADAVLDKVNAAYRAATSQGLAQSFAKRSTELSSSMLLWVLVLVAALCVSGFLASNRFPEILTAIGGKPEWAVVFVHALLGAFSLAPSVWLAWVATKQIGQRFRLAEDYSYKAALSTAYEGYRNEAAKLDPLFEAQLFATAIGRLDELPLRLIEKEVHGSPLNEFLKSSRVKEDLKFVPGYKDKLIAILNHKNVSDDLASNSSKIEQ
jgi:hypothetical protein